MLNSKKKIKQEYSVNASYDQLWSMTQCKNFINETLRRYPISGFWYSSNSVPITLNGTTFPKQTTFMFATTPFALQAFSDGEKFDPDRWNTKFTPDQNLWSTISFGGFRRICIGQNLALLELLSLISVTCANFHINLAPNQKDVDLLDCETNFIMETKQDIFVTVTPRKDATLV